MFLNAVVPPPPEAMWSSIEHGRLHHGTKEERAQEWGRLKAQGVKAGLFDAIIAWKCCIAIELKAGRNKLTAEQRNMRAAWVNNGGFHIEARSVSEVDAALRALGLPIPRSMQIAAQGHDAELSVPEPPKRAKRGRNWNWSGEERAAESATRLQQFLDEP